MTKDTEEEETIDVVHEWMIRPCTVYEEEYKDCRSIKGRFQQYFVYGQSIDCTQWKRDLDNCNKWTENRNIKAVNELIASEKNRRNERLRAHYANDIWQKRKSPPGDWDKPLPEHMQKEYENTYLDIKNREMKHEIEPVIDSKCSIM